MAVLLWTIGAAAAPVSAQDGIDNMRLLGRNGDEMTHAMDLLVIGDHAYASVGLDLGLRTYNLADPTQIVRLDQRGLPAWRACASGDTLFSFLHDRGVEMYDISAGLPVLLGRYDPGGATSYAGGARVGEFLYVAAHNEGIHRLLLTESTAPDFWDPFTLSNNACWDLVARDGHLFVANGRHGLSVVEIASQTEIAVLDLPGLANDILFAEDGQTVFLTLGAAGVAAIDVRDPAQPALLSQTGTFGHAFSMDRVGDILVTGSSSYAERFDIRDPEAVTRNGWDATHVYAMGAGAGVNSRGDTLLVIADWRGLSVYAPRADAAGDIEVYPPRLDFGVAGAPTDTTVKVRNNGGGPLTVLSIHTPDGLTAYPTSFIVSPGETQAVTITAQPQQVRGQILYVSDDPEESTFTQLAYANNTSFPQIGSVARDFTLLGTDGHHHTLRDYRGKVVYLEFTADRLPTCSLQAAATDATLHEAFDPDDVVIFRMAASMALLETFRDVYGMRFIGLEDTGNRMYQNYRLPDTEALYPQNIVIDQFGRIAYWSWEYDPQEVVSVIDDLLNCFCIIDPTATEPQLRLYAPRPSLFSRQTDLWFQLVQPGSVQVTVFDSAGRLVRILADGDRRAGDQRVVWDGRDRHMQPVPDGTYFVRLRADQQQQSQRVVVVR